MHHPEALPNVATIMADHVYLILYSRNDCDAEHLFRVVVEQLKALAV